MTQVLERVEIAAPERRVLEGRQFSELDLLCEAAELIARPHGWCKHDSERMTPYGPAYCMTGAIRRAAVGHNTELVEVACARLLRVLKRYATDFTVGIEEWNDAPQRRKSQVLRMLRLAGDCATEV
jgi:hypothetical protein